MATEEYRLEPMGDDVQRPLLATTCKRIHFGKQMRQLLLAGARRWLVTAACIGAIYVTLAHYSDKVVMSTVKKRIFNGVITGLSIALGLSIASSLKWMASELKWWVLSCKGWTLQEVDLILHGESISHLIKLSHVSRAWSTHVYVSLWILLNIASQVAVAMLGLTYSVGQNDETALTKSGDVRIPDMTTIKGERLITSTQVGTHSELQYTANSYGFIAVAYGVGTLDDVPPPRTLTDAISYLYYCGTDRCEYYFSETSPREDSRSHISVTTSRSVASSGSCMSWPVIEGGGGNSTSITVSGGPNGSTLKKDIPIAGGVDQTTFMVNTSQACGPACSQISAFEASATAPWYYECNVTIAKVANATLPEHQLGQNLTTLASAAIALQGVGTSSLSRDQTAQFQSYPAEAIFGAPQNGTTGGMGRLMAQFAMGVVAVTAQYNPKITTRGEQPIVGTKLDVNWNNVHLVLLITGCVQLCLTLAAVMIANRVVARDDGPLATARLLKSAITYPDDRASTASGKEIAKACGGKTRFVYGVQTQRTKAGDVYHVQIREGAPTPKPFPPGLYD